MSNPLRTITKELLLSTPFTRAFYWRKVFLTRPPCCLGIYSSFAQARADAPSEKLSGYNHRTIPEFYKPRLDDFNRDDYPILFWFSRLLPDAKLVFELGGSIGIGYYSYKKYLAMPAQLRWIICETPETVRVGREIAQERKEEQLSFTDDRMEGELPDIYATFGTLQYIEESFAEIIRARHTRPPHLLVNRVPLCEQTAFITLQNNGLWFSPYKVDNKTQFIQSLESLGYELVDSWDMVRPNVFLLDSPMPIPKYYGMYFRLK